MGVYFVCRISESVHSFDRSTLKRPSIGKRHPLQEIVPDHIDSSCRNLHIGIMKNLGVIRCLVFSLEVC